MAVDGRIPGRFHGVVVDSQFGGGFLNIMLQVLVQFGVEEPCSCEQLPGLLQQFQFKRIPFGFLGNGLDRGHEQTELLFRSDAEGRQVLFTKKRNRQGAERLFTAESHGQQVIQI